MSQTVKTAASDFWIVEPKARRGLRPKGPEAGRGILGMGTSYLG